METGQQSNVTTQAPAQEPSVSAAPPHTKTQSTLAPTSEYVRYLLLALPARYIPRGIVGAMFDTSKYDKNMLGRSLIKVSEWAKRTFHVTNEVDAKHKAAFAYNSIMGLGSLALTASYSWSVYKDIKNIFGEAVAFETDKSAAQVTRGDLQRSDNRIVQKTMSNFWYRLGKRALTDLFFFPAAAARSSDAGDLMVGIKAGQAFTETWERKPTMFEDLVTFVNNKINPRNGLGQAISVGEVFDLYQHYTDGFAKDRMFTNVLERGTGEGARWAQSQPIFERLTQLMNLTYAYKHSSMLDPKTGHAIHQADFTLPKLIYLLGHDLIDVNKPEQTLTTIEVANRFGIPAVKQMRAMLADGIDLAEVKARFPAAAIPAPEKKVEPASEKNGVIAKGSTRQLDAAEGTVPSTLVDVQSLINQQTLNAPQVNRAPA